jgi:hypothetical protein
VIAPGHEVLECVRRMDADVAAVVSATVARGGEARPILELAASVTASCRNALTVSAGQPESAAWREFCRSVAGFLSRASYAGVSIESRDALARLRALLAENADLLA